MFSRIEWVFICTIVVCLWGYAFETISESYKPPKGPTPLEKVIRERIWWIARHTEYSPFSPLPKIVFRTREEIQIGFYGRDQYRRALLYRQLGIDSNMDRILAYYNTKTDTIYIQKYYEERRIQGGVSTRRTKEIPFYLEPRWSAIIIHELVHYLRDVNGYKQPRCHLLDEVPAYSLQWQWIHEHDLDVPSPLVLRVLMANPCT